MAEFDVAVLGGTVVDGTGGPGRIADVGLVGDRIARVGTIAPHEARRVVDATGLVVGPGFVDVHTHYDAQLLWDPTASPSLQHGVTTVAFGNCGYTLAPVVADDVAFLSALMARVEGLPIASLESLAWSWRSFAEYLDALDGRTVPNVSVLIGHSAVRRKVMGEAATGEAATPEQVEAMVGEVRAAVAAGVWGFSSSRSPIHFDGAGAPVPSRAAAPDELVALAAALRGTTARAIEFIPDGVTTELASEDAELMWAMARVSGLPVNWNTITVNPRDPEKHRREMDTYGSPPDVPSVVGLMLPFDPIRWTNFMSGVTLGSIPGWKEVFAEPTAEGRIRALRDPTVREAIQGTSRRLGWSALVFAEVFDPRHQDVIGRSAAELAAERGTEPLDVILEVVIDDELRTGLRRDRAIDEAALRAASEVWTDPRIVLGASDAGAHLDIQCGASFTTDLLVEGVRSRELIGLEEAIRLITDVPARLSSYDRRGRIAEGWFGDLTVFDLDGLGVPDVSTRDDLPASSSRVYASAEGYRHVFVNGVEALTAGEPTGATPGSLLRSGD